MRCTLIYHLTNGLTEFGCHSFDVYRSRGYGIFDKGATGNATSRSQLEKLKEDDPSSFGEIDTDSIKVIGFGGGTRVLSLGV